MGAGLLESRVNGDSSVERLRERQEAAGNGLRNQNEGGGCLLFARRNGSASNAWSIQDASHTTHRKVSADQCRQHNKGGK